VGALETAELVPFEAASSAVVRATAPPSIAGRYELLELIAMGGMGSIYRVRDVALDEVVALKLMKRETRDAPRALDRFRAEVRLARRVTHANVARTFDLGEHEGEPFITMELVDGESLARVLAREGRLSLDRTRQIARGICDGLAAVHAAGVVHCDLKPDNILLARSGRVVIGDFGIAWAKELAATGGRVVGSAPYIAPEQLDDGSVDARVDIYALGALLYEMLTGRRAWSGASPAETVRRRLVEPPPDPRCFRPDLPAAVANVIMRCMARAPEERFADVRSVAEALCERTPPRATAHRASQASKMLWRWSRNRAASRRPWTSGPTRTRRRVRRERRGSSSPSRAARLHARPCRSMDRSSRSGAASSSIDPQTTTLSRERTRSSPTTARAGPSAISAAATARSSTARASPNASAPRRRSSASDAPSSLHATT
jgi:serine/threonine protein kinase